MKLVTFCCDGDLRLGCVVENKVIDLNYAYREMLKNQGQSRAEQISAALLPSDMLEFLEGAEESLNRARHAVNYAIQNTPSDTAIKMVYNYSDIRLEAPVLNPRKIICVGLNYRDHILEMNREFPQFPVIFAKFSNSIISANEDIPLSADITQKLDYEGELAFVIGKKARKVSQKDALEYVAGYTIVNDISARDLQKRTLQWLQGKTLDGSLPMGPYLVTRDEIPNPLNLGIAVTVNGEVRQKSNTENLVFDINYLVEFLSHLMTLEPGDVICTGTPGGVGEADGVFLKNGDVIRVNIDGIGFIENRVVC